MARRPERDQTEALSFVCRACGHPLERMPSGYLGRPVGHGRLVRVAEDDPQPFDDRDGFGGWPAEELPTAA